MATNARPVPASLPHPFLKQARAHSVEFDECYFREVAFIRVRAEFANLILCAVCAVSMSNNVCPGRILSLARLRAHSVELDECYFREVVIIRGTAEFANLFLCAR